MPAASHVEKEGHFTNTQRLLQWRDKALEPPGDARSELHFMYHLIRRVKAHYARLRATRTRLADPQPARGTTRSTARTQEPERRGGAEGDQRLRRRHRAARERLLASCKADGSTASGCWIYAGCYADGVNQTRRRDPGDPATPDGWISPEWGWAWPANRRILYNRASADPQGRPWSERKKLHLVGRGGGQVDRLRRAGLPARPSGRTTSRPHDAEGMDAISGDDPFIMMGDGRAWLYTPSGLLDGAAADALRADRVAGARTRCTRRSGANPAAITWKRAGEPAATRRAREYPIVASTFRLTEHHTTGPMSRNLPWLAELQPEMFAEIDPVLAAERGIEDGGWMVDRRPSAARSRRGPRSPAASGRCGSTAGIVHQISVPWHWGTLHDLRAGRHGRLAQRPGRAVGRPQHVDRGQDVLLQGPRRAPRAARRRSGSRTRRSVPTAPDERARGRAAGQALPHATAAGTSRPPETA